MGFPASTQHQEIPSEPGFDLVLVKEYIFTKRQSLFMSLEELPKKKLKSSQAHSLYVTCM